MEEVGAKSNGEIAKGKTEDTALFANIDQWKEAFRDTKEDKRKSEADSERARDKSADELQALQIKEWMEWLFGFIEDKLHTFLLQSYIESILKF